jgi:hypothetical protein
MLQRYISMQFAMQIAMQIAFTHPFWGRMSILHIPSNGEHPAIMRLKPKRRYLLYGPNTGIPVNSKGKNAVCTVRLSIFLAKLTIQRASSNPILNQFFQLLELGAVNIPEA